MYFAFCAFCLLGLTVLFVGVNEGFAFLFSRDGLVPIGLVLGAVEVIFFGHHIIVNLSDMVANPEGYSTFAFLAFMTGTMTITGIIRGVNMKKD